MDYFVFKIINVLDGATEIVEGFICSTDYASAMKALCYKYDIAAVLYLEKLHLWNNAIDLGEIMDGRASMEDMIEKFSKKS